MSQHTSEDLSLWAKLYEHARQLHGDELRVLSTLAERLAMGRRQYGPLRIENDQRDWRKEAAEEALDLSVYLTIDLLKR